LQILILNKFFGYKQGKNKKIMQNTVFESKMEFLVQNEFFVDFIVKYDFFDKKLFFGFKNAFLEGF